MLPKYLKRFAAGCLLCVFLTAIACGGALVNANSRELALGRKEQQAGFRMDRQTVTFFVERQKFQFPSAAKALRLARLAPPPVGSLLEILECLISIA